MLIIRPEQVVALQRSMDEAFLRRVRVLLRERDGDLVEDYTDEQLDQTLVHALRRARSHGLGQERTLTTFIRLWFFAGG